MNIIQRNSAILRYVSLYLLGGLSNREFSKYLTTLKTKEANMIQDFLTTQASKIKPKNMIICLNTL